MEAILAAATLVGGVAAIWFFIEKARAWRWRRRAPETLPSPVPISTPTIGPIGEVAETVKIQAPAYELIRPSTGASDGGTEPPDLVGPWSCEGDFFGTGERATALIVRDGERGGYSVIVIGSPTGIEKQLFVLDRGIESPANMYLSTVPPGSYHVSRVVWKHGGPQRIYLRLDGIELGAYESASRVFYWNDADRKFHEQWMTD